MATTRGTILAYNPSNRTAIVDVPGRGRLLAENYLPAGRTPSTAMVNVVLPREESGTVLPASSFEVGDPVSLLLESGKIFLLGKVIGTASPVSNLAGVQVLAPGAISLEKTVTTDAEGKVILPGIGRRAQINRIVATKSGGGDFSLLLKDNFGVLQASWGDGEVPIEDVLEDAAGFAFLSPDQSAHLTFSPSGTYTLQIQGERFA